MHVLLLGVEGSDQRVIGASIAEVSPSSGVARASHWSEVPRDANFGCIFVGAAAAEPGWDAFEQLLRRNAPAATLVALPETEVASTGWDDVVLPSERSENTLRRVVRHGLKLHEAQERLSRWALRDPLTNVLNRRGLERLLAREASNADRGQGTVSVALVDIDDFKSVNDQLGMAGGDRTLREIADAIVDQVRQGDSVARVGGDEFLVLLPGARTWEAVEVAERIRQAVSHSVRAGDEVVTVSIGVRRLTEDVRTLEAVLEATQEGLRVSKASGKDQVHVSTTRASTSASMGDVSLPPGQPMHNFIDELLVDATGLARRIARRVGLPPEEALQLSMQRAVQAEWDLHWFGAAARRGPGKLHPTLPVHIRLYPSTLHQVPSERLQKLLAGRLAPQQLVVDIDEQFLSGDPGSLLPTMDALREVGVTFCLDVSDFGKGCLEGLIVLRPEVVHLRGHVFRAAARSRSRMASLRRFLHSVDALELQLACTDLKDQREVRDAWNLGFGLLGERLPTA